SSGMNQLPFDKPGRFWRGNLHTHSTNSDGTLSPEQVCRRYAEAGYDFLALTEHFLARYNFPITDTRPLRTETFTTLLGAELHTGRAEMGEMWHILAVGLPLDFAPPVNDESGPAIAARALDAGAFVSMAHPSRCVLTEGDAVALGNVHAVEIYNAGSADENDRADSWPYLELLLGRGHQYFAHAADDFHNLPYRRDFAMGWVHVKAEALDPDTLLTALKSGHFYSSTGPQIHDIQVEPGKSLYVRCSPVESVFVTGTLARAARVHGLGITEAALDISKFTSPYCRVTVRDAQGRRAWSNPIWFAE
ncbi:MAG: CehA/McbA family metallohydrolase, partial [Caldilineaceae bacterium]|nr:CehA/McbA family metallohydrolase [Caldilineaceae bacterium]